jgi:AraC-like DNA-binding protein
MGCSTEKLNKVCKEYLGKNVLTIIHEETILEIRRQILIGNYSLKEIAYNLNFDTPQNFTAFVKNRTGMTPTELQMSLRGAQKPGTTAEHT